MLILAAKTNGHLSSVPIYSSHEPAEKTYVSVGKKRSQNFSPRKEVKKQKKLESLNSKRLLLKAEPFNTCFVCLDQLVGLDNFLGPHSEKPAQIKSDMMEMEKEKSGSSLTLLRSTKVIEIMLEIKRKLVEFTCSEAEGKNPNVSTKLDTAISSIDDMTNLLKFCNETMH